MPLENSLRFKRNLKEGLKPPKREIDRIKRRLKIAQDLAKGG